ncbi:hypothetical protein BDW02DRAFT_127436 [Decorospora gaudefroyi]|uniref:Zn(2)-C6 fungal-type domain-containing protein n=1 Tax=Decorospora gaudefroyi TaxID=184978 RepID=A0A6A5K0V8_9PLEO|nr:hypothetical protein BDW02DRAFT_127436 [Decorospora gaudefroyi]
MFELRRTRRADIRSCRISLISAASSTLIHPDLAPRSPKSHNLPQTLMETPRANRNALRCITCRLRKVKCTGGSAPCENCRRLKLNCTFPRPGDGEVRNMPLVSPTEAVTEAGTARRRTTAACQRCRARKTKCDGQRPQCCRCQQQGADCAYLEDGPRRGYNRRTMSLQGTSQSPDRSVRTTTVISGSTEQTATMDERAPLDVVSQRAFLSRDVLAQHIEAYFVHIYHLPGYNFFHRPSILEDLHNDRLAPILSTAICAIVSGYLNRSKEGKQLSLRWAMDVDAYIFANLNNLTLLNLQVMMLSLCQQFAYRQFGRSWLILGMATRLALGIQLNKGARSTPQGGSVALRECKKRLAWSIFIQDKLHSGGIDELVAMPRRWMHVSLPMDEEDFDRERDRQTALLSSGVATLPSENLGISGYLVLLMDLRHDILQKTKSIISKGTSVPHSGDPTMLTPLVRLQADLQHFYSNLPPHLYLTDRIIFAHSSSPELIAYVNLHTWYFQTCCDLFRICLPGVSRESALADVMTSATGDFVAGWQCLAVSFAFKLASTWKRLLDLRASGALFFPGDLSPLDPANCVHIYQVTKILLTARRYKLYSGLIDPLSEEPVFLDDDAVDRLCQSNLSYIRDLASIAPIAAVVQKDVKTMVDAEIIRNPRRRSETSVAEEVPVTSQTQKDHVLSRYNVLAMGIAASTSNSSPPGEGGSYTSTPPSRIQDMSISGSTGVPSHVEHHRATISLPTETNPLLRNATTNTNIHQASAPSSSYPLQQPLQQYDLGDFASGHNNVLSSDLSRQSWATPTNMGSDPSYSNDWPMEYCVAGSRFDMNGELDWFLMNSLMQGQ